MVSDLTRRAALSRRAGVTFDGARDLWQVAGYPTTLGPDDYVAAYNRGNIAQRIVDAYPAATWREPPTLLGDDTFRESFDALLRRVPLWQVIQRADRLAGLGHYGVVVLGLDGAEDMAQPARGNNYHMIYAQPHGERTADVSRWDIRPESPRYGRPHLYNVTTGTNWTGTGGGQRLQRVHHSRVVHFAENALEDVSIGTPTLESVWNRLLDVEKLLGSGAEMFWQNSAMLMHLQADLDVQWDPEEADALRDQVEEMQHGLRRWLRTRGVDASNIAPGLQGADPVPQIMANLDFIAGTKGIPKRILIGSEAGELASSQDTNNFDARVTERRKQHAEPNILVPLIDRLLALGVLRGRFDGVEWPESDNLGEEKRAAIAQANATALATYSNAPGAELIVSPEEFRRVLGYTDPLPGFVEDEILQGDGNAQ